MSSMKPMAILWIAHSDGRAVLSRRPGRRRHTTTEPNRPSTSSSTHPVLRQLPRRLRQRPQCPARHDLEGIDDGQRRPGPDLLGGPGRGQQRSSGNRRVVSALPLPRRLARRARRPAHRIGRRLQPRRPDRRRRTTISKACTASSATACRSTRAHRRASSRSTTRTASTGSTTRAARWVSNRAARARTTTTCARRTRRTRGRAPSTTGIPTTAATATTSPIRS